MPAVAAQAGAEECADTYYATSGRELFEPSREWVPEPLRGTGWDCASRIHRDSGDPLAATYTLIWVDISWQQFVAVVRSFEDSEWVIDDDGLITGYDLAGNGAQPVDTDT